MADALNGGRSANLGAENIEDLIQEYFVFDSEFENELNAESSAEEQSDDDGDQRMALGDEDEQGNHPLVYAPVHLNELQILCICHVLVLINIIHIVCQTREQHCL